MNQATANPEQGK
jgi:hypothetical protein